MQELSETTLPPPTGTNTESDLLTQYGCGPIRFSGHSDALYERHLLFDDVIDPVAAGAPRTLRGRRPVGQGRVIAALGQNRAHL